MAFGLNEVGRRASALARAFAGGSAKERGQWLAREEAIMGTAIRVELWADDREAGETCIDAVMDEMHRIDRAMSPHKPESELSIINREAAAKPVRLSDEMFRLVERAIHFSELSDGAFDITYASAGHLYDYRQGVLPTDEMLSQARRGIGWKHLMLDRRLRTLRPFRPAPRESFSPSFCLMSSPIEPTVLPSSAAFFGAFDSRLGLSFV